MGAALFGLLLGIILTIFILYTDPETCKPVSPVISHGRDFVWSFWSSRTTYYYIFGWLDTELAEGAKTAVKETGKLIVAKTGAAAVSASAIMLPNLIRGAFSLLR